jgi:hypothetical protein
MKSPESSLACVVQKAIDCPHLASDQGSTGTEASGLGQNTRLALHQAECT